MSSITSHLMGQLGDHPRFVTALNSWDDLGFTKTTLLTIRFSARNMEMEPNIENMTMSEYLEYEAVKERILWDDVRSKRSPTHYDEADFSYSRRNKSNTFYYPYSHDIPPPPIQSYPKNYLVSTERMEQDIDQDSICEQDDDLEDDQEEGGDDRDIFYMWDITVEDLLQVDAHGVVLGSFFSTGRHFKFGLVRYQAKEDDGIFVIMDVTRRRRLGAWLRACCLFILPRKSRGVFRSNYNLVLEFSLYNRDIVQTKWEEGSRIIT
ncbi:hypothetical protein Tco_1078594 [Tanacetum coccineum]|uniref:Uncharacterized protein n=1 Tax=Tanacetum coccineum TaxID=301880 RepID=A0ABQ5HQB8_9ASTR